MVESKAIIFIISVIIWKSTLITANQDSSNYEFSIINTEHSQIFCCPSPGQIYSHENLSCVESTNNGLGSSLNKFGHHLRRSCVQISTTMDKNNSFQVGALIKAPKDAVCTSPDVQQVNNSDSANTTQLNTNSTINFLFCEFIFEQTTIRNINAIIMLTSVPFIILTILMIHIIHPNFSSLHKKSVFCYLSALSVAFLTHSIENLGYHFPAVHCMILGYTTYFAFLASYAWLSVISYNIFFYIDTNWDATSKVTRSRTFKIYSLFSWGLPTLMLGIMFYSQRATWIGDEYKPVLGKPNYCWFSREKYGKIIFFCTERIILLSFNIIMFILTIRRFYRQRCLCKPLHSNVSRFSCLGYRTIGPIVRVFMVMGLSWTVEMFSCFFSEHNIFDYLFIFISIQGYLIFILFMTRYDSKRFLKNWYYKLHHSRSEKGVVFKKVETI